MPVLLSREFAVLQEEVDQASELLGVLWCGIELVLELNKSASVLELSSSCCAVSFSICAISLSSCFGFAGLRLHPLLVRDLPLLFFVLQLLHSLLVFDFFSIEFDLSKLVVDHGSPLQHR